MAAAMLISMAACNTPKTESSATSSETTTAAATETTTETTTEATSETTSASEEDKGKDEAAYIKGIAGVWVEDTGLDPRVMTIEEDGKFKIEFRGGGSMFGTVKLAMDGDKPVLEFDMGEGDIMKVTSVAEPGKQEEIAFDRDDFLAFKRENTGN